MQRFAPLPADAARFARRSPGDRWFVDETYVKVNGVWRYVYRAIDQHGQVIDVLVSTWRDAAAARRFFTRALRTLKVQPSEVVTDAAPVYSRVLDELLPATWHHVERYANNPIEADHSQLKHRLRPMRGLRIDRSAQVIVAGHAFVQNLRAATTSLPSTPRLRRASPQRSPNSLKRSDQLRPGGSPRLPNEQRNGTRAPVLTEQWRSGGWFACGTVVKMQKRDARQHSSGSLGEAIAGLYQVFARYGLKAIVDGCPHCVDDHDERALHRVPLRQLSGEDWTATPVRR